MRRETTHFLALGCGALLLLAACDDRGQDGLADPAPPAPAFTATGPPAPGALATVTFGGASLDFWPFTGTDFQNAADPINLVFVGKAEPRALRAALMALDGNRVAVGFPAGPPFDCVWKDAVGAIQTSYSTDGWSASAVQLECGDYSPLRFHVRLFAAGAVTVANAHIDVLIPGTADHEVVSWELAEQLVVADFLRSGLLDGATPVAPTSVINPAPSYRAIDPRVYNGLPAPLIAAIGGPAQPAAAPVPIPSDGRATALNVAGSTPLQPGVAEAAFTIQFGQFIPKPFCSSGPLDWVRVDGPVEVRHTVAIDASGGYEIRARIHGRLQVTPVDILSSPPAPIGDTHEAEVVERYFARVSDHQARAASLQLRTLLPTGHPFGGRSKVVLSVGPAGATDHRVEVNCGA